MASKAAADRPSPGTAPGSRRPRIAVFAGPTATVLNTHPLYTSARAGGGASLPADGFDRLVPQRLAAPAVVYVERFSAHPLEADAAELYGPPHGYVGTDGSFSVDRRSPADRAVYRVELSPGDGLYPLPYVAQTSDGRPWTGDLVDPGAPERGFRQPFYPDASRLFEEIDRFELDASGRNNQLTRMADFDFHRIAPPGGFTKGREDGEGGAIPPEVPGVDFFPYRPHRFEPSRQTWARITSRVQMIVDGDDLDGVIWLEGTPFVEETAYWLNLLVDTTIPIVCCSGNIGESSRRNVVDAVRLIASGRALDEHGRNRLGVVGVHDGSIVSARELQKSDDRPGGFVPTGGHGGVLGAARMDPPEITFLPARQHTYRSAVRQSELPDVVSGVGRSEGRLSEVPVRLRGADGELDGSIFPQVTFHKHARYLPDADDGDSAAHVELRSRIEWNLRHRPLSGIVVEGAAPYGHVTGDVDAELRRGLYSGIPFVKVSRGNADGFVHRTFVRDGIRGSNLTATKARLLLAACLLRFGAPPPAANPAEPTDEEVQRIREHLAQFQEVFDTH